MACRLLIVAPNAYPAVFPNRGNRIGGLETFAWTLARGVASLSEAESCILLHHTSGPKLTGGAKVAQVDGVEIYVDVERLRDIRREVSKAIARNGASKLPQLRSFYPSLLWHLPVLVGTKLLVGKPSIETRWRKIVSEAAPSAILTLGTNATSALVGQIAKQLSVPCYLWLQSDADLDPRLFEDHDYVDPYGVRYEDALASIEHAIHIICQNDRQSNRVEAMLGRGSTKIVNPIDTQRFMDEGNRFDDRENVLWIGRYDQFHKRPLLGLEIARKCPKHRFKFVINPGDETIQRAFLKDQPPNIELLSFIPPDQMPRLLNRSKIFLSTGSPQYEGFPNVLLEASASGTPIVSLADFDGYIGKSHSGISADKSTDQAAVAIERLFADPVQWQHLSTQGRRYVCEHHSVQTCVSRLMHVINGNSLE